MSDSLRTRASHYEYKLNIHMVVDNEGSLIGYNVRQETPAGLRGNAILPVSDLERLLNYYLDPEQRMKISAPMWGIVSEPDKYSLDLECWREFLGDKEYKRIRERFEKMGLQPDSYSQGRVVCWRRPLTDDEFYALAEKLGIVEKLEKQK